MNIRNVFYLFRILLSAKLLWLPVVFLLSACLEQAKVESGESSYQPPGPNFSGSLSTVFVITNLGSDSVAVNGQCSSYDSNLEISDDGGTTWYSISGSDVDCSDETFAFEINGQFTAFNPPFGVPDWSYYFSDPNVSGTRTFKIRSTNLFGFSRMASVIVRYQAPLDVGFTLTSSDVNENANSKTIAVTLSAAPVTDVTVDYEFAGGTATVGEDFTLTAGTLHFNPGVTTRNITVRPLDDGIYEGNETVELALNNASPVVNIVGGSHTLTINENESYPQVQFAAASSSANEDASSHDIYVQLSPPSAFAVDVGLQASGASTATVGTDTIPLQASVSIPAGQTSTSFSFAPSEDSLFEGSEMVRIELANPVNATIGLRNSHDFFINDNDSAPSFSFALSNDSTTEDTGSATVTVNLSTSYPDELQVGYRIRSGGTATAGTDYVFSDGTLTFAAADTAEDIQFTIVPDNVTEVDETIFIELHDPTGGATLGAILQHTHTIMNDDAPPTVDITTADTGAPESTSAHTVTVSLSHASDIGVSVPFTISGTADGNDYTVSPVSGVLNFSGSTSQTISFTISDDSDIEGNENIIVTLGSPTNATLGTVTTHTYTIQEDDLSAFTWTGLSGNNLWSTAGNWAGGAVPGSGDDVNFNSSACSGADCNVTIDQAVNVASINLLSGFTGTITQGGFGVTTDNFNVGGGIYQGHVSAGLAVNQNTNINGGTLMLNGSYLQIRGDFIYTSGTVIWNATPVDFVGTIPSTINAPGLNFSSMYLQKESADVQIVGTVSVTGDLTINYVNASGGILGGMIQVGGNLNVTRVNGGSATIVLSGSSNQSISGASGGILPHLSIASTGGTVLFDNVIQLAGDFTYISGTVDFASSTVEFLGSTGSTITPPSSPFANLTFAKTTGGSITLANDVGANNFLLNNTGAPVNGFELHLYGDASMMSGAGGTTGTRFLGTNNQVLSRIAGTWPGGTVSIDKPAGTLTLASPFMFSSSGQDLEVLQGTFDLADNDLTINDNLSTAAGTIIDRGCAMLNFASHSPSNGTILGGSPNPSISIADVTMAEGLSGTIDFEFVVTLDEAYCAGALSVNYATANGTATAGDDYQPASGTLNISSGTTGTISVSVFGDSVSESDETFLVNISSASAGTIVDATATGTIVNDDIAGLTFEKGLAGGSVRAVAFDDSNRKVVVGDFQIYDETLNNGIARLLSTGAEHPSFAVGRGFNGEVLTVVEQPDGKLLVGGNFTSYDGEPYNRLIRLMPNGTPDSTFNIGTGANSEIHALAVQSDGRIIVGGNFSTFGGVSRNRIVRLNEDGTVDGTFSIGSGFNGRVNTIKVLPDDDILVGGDFVTFNGATTNRLVRLNTNGSRDSGLNVGSGLNGEVRDIAVQSDGRIVVTGAFTSYNGASSARLIRLMNDGSIDASFNFGSGLNATGHSVAIQDDGKIVVGGGFNSYAGTASYKLVRMNTDGTIDAGFTSGFETTDVVSKVFISSGGILVAGTFNNYSGNFSRNVVRLQDTGNFDFSFSTGLGFSGSVNTITELNNGDVVAVGIFESFAGTERRGIARFDTSGELDFSFASGSGFNGLVSEIEIQDDGRIIVAGEFTEYNGFSAGRIARLDNMGALDGSFGTGAGFNATVKDIEYDSYDGSVFVAGEFTEFDGISRNYLVKLGASGALDLTYNAGVGPNGPVHAIAHENNGRMLIGGAFTSVGGSVRNYLALLNWDGTLSSNFVPSGSINNVVTSVESNHADRFIVGGEFTGRIAILNFDGSVDGSFNAGSGFNGAVELAVSPPDGKILVGGAFTSYNGTSVNRLVRLNSNGTIDGTFHVGTGFDDTVYGGEGTPDKNIIVVGAFKEFDGAPSRYTKILEMPASLSIGVMNVRDVMNNGFELEVGAVGDTNSNAMLNIQFCNENANPGCDPGLEPAYSMAYDDWRFGFEIGGLTNPSDLFNILITGTDPDGISGVPVVGTVELLPNIWLTPDQTTALEGASVVITAQIGDSSYSKDIIFSYQAYSASADASDFSPISGTATIPAGSTSVNLPAINIIDDGMPEGVEYFTVSIWDIRNASPSDIDSVINIVDAQNGLILSNLQALNPTTNSFDVSVDFANDVNNTGIVYARFCSVTDDPGCDPLAGPSFLLARATTNFFATINGLSSPYDPGDTIRVALEIYDSDGFIDQTVAANVVLPNTQNELILQSMNISSILPDGFTVEVTFTGDDNMNVLSPVLWYCNDTDNPGCAPSLGANFILNRNGNVFEGVISNLLPPHDPGDTLRLEILNIDPDGGSPASLQEMVTLDGSGSTTEIFRSVGTQDILACGRNGGGCAAMGFMDINSDIATFVTDLPERIGVGDAVVFDCNGGGLGVGDCVVFIHERLDSRNFIVKNFDGSSFGNYSTPEWRIYRAYTTLQNAEEGYENPEIMAVIGSAGDFDLWTGGLDLAGSGLRWNIAFYNDVPDTTGLIIDGWNTDASRRLRFFVPHTPQEVGVSQRHKGNWLSGGATIRVNGTIGILVADNHVVIEGFRVEASGSNSIGIWIEQVMAGLVVVKQNIIHQQDSFGSSYGIYSYNGSGTTHIYNNIVSNSSNACFNLQDKTNYVYNNTAANCGSYGYVAGFSSSSLLINNIAYSTQGYSGSFAAGSNFNMSSDSSTTGGINDRAYMSPSFADPINFNFQLLSFDTSARDMGMDLSGNVYLAFSEDITGAGRMGSWDLGASEAIFAASLSVQPVYPSFPNWNDYIDRGTFGSIYDQPQNPCSMPNNETYDEGCIHSGPLKRVNVTSETTCDGLAMEDALGVFEWTCESSGFAVFFTKGFKPGKGLRDLIWMSNWRPNSVTLYKNSVPVASSDSMHWWSNNISPLPANGGGSPMYLSDPGTIYYVDTTLVTAGYYIDADRISIVTMPQAKLRHDGQAANCDAGSAQVGTDLAAVLFSSSRSYLWIEADIDGDNSSDAHSGIYGSDWRYSVIHNSTITGTNPSGSYHGVTLLSSTSNLISNVSVFEGSGGLNLEGSNYNIVKDFRAAGAYSNDASLLNVQGGNNKFINISLAKHNALNVAHALNVNGSNNIFVDTNISNVSGVIESIGIHVLSASTGNVFSKVTVTGVSQNGILVRGNENLFRFLTLANMQTAISLMDGADTNLFQTLGVVNVQVGIHGAASGNNNVENYMIGNYMATPFNNLTGFTAFTGFNYSGYDLSNAHGGHVTVDSTNTVASSGLALFSNIIDEQWLAFDSRYRAWGRDSFLGSISAIGPCSSNCRVWDWRVRADNYLYESSFAGSMNGDFIPQEPCPSPLNSETLPRPGTSDTFLKHAVEIMGDLVGDDDSLCEDNENCIYSPNIGSYQGEGDYRGLSCDSSSSGKANVKMFKYPKNGVSF